MIEINFPENPENYIFNLTPRFASTYLVARAARHYGVNNINVVSAVNTIQRTELRFDEDRKNVHHLAELIGLPGVRTISLDGFTGASNSHLTFTGELNGELIHGSLMKFYNALEPAYETPDEVDGGAVSLRRASRQVALLLEAGILTPEFELNTTSPYKTIVTEYTSSRRDYRLARQQLFAQRVYPKWTEVFQACQPEGPFWAPIIDNTLTEVLTSAKEEGLEELMLATRFCSYHDRPIHCGVCQRCVQRRHALLQAGITDTTQYELAT